MPGSAPKSADSVADAFLAAYNARDFDACADLLAEEVRLVHHGPGVDVSGRDAVVAMFRASAAGPFPDRRFLDTRRRIVVGEHAIIEHTWQATAARDVPGFGAAGETVRLELATILTVREGRIAEYTEYG